MKKKLFVFAVFTACMGLMLSGCKKEQEAEGPKEEILSAVSLNDLEPGHFYVKSGDSFYLLPVEDCNFDPARPAQSANSKGSGMRLTDSDKEYLKAWGHLEQDMKQIEEAELY